MVSCASPECFLACLLQFHLGKITNLNEIYGGNSSMKTTISILAGPLLVFGKQDKIGLAIRLTIIVALSLNMSHLVAEENARAKVNVP